MMAGLSMIANNNWFLLAWELRRWREQYGKVAILIVGFSLLCTLLSFTIATGNKLYNGKPIWINDSFDYITITNQNKTGELSPVNKITLLAAQQQPFIKTATSFAIKSYSLSIDSKQPTELTALWYSDSFLDILDIPFSEKEDMIQNKGIWISDRYWTENYKNRKDIIGSIATNARLPNGLIIRGILPKHFNKIGSWSPDIWVSESYIGLTTPFSSGEMRDCFLLAAPLYYGIFTVDKKHNTDSTYKSLKEKDLTISAMQFSGDGSSLKVFEQVNLEPQARATLLLQFRLLFILAISLSIILCVNTFTLYSTQIILHREEYRILRVIGAKPFRTFHGAILLTALFVISVSILSLPIIYFANELIASKIEYNTNATFKFEISLYYYILSVIAVGVLLFLSAGINYLPANLGASFNRDMNTTRSKFDVFSSHLLFALQMMIAIVALTLLASLYLNQLLKNSPQTLAENIITQQIKLKGQHINVSNIIEGNIPNVNKDAIAVSKNTFDKPNYVEATILATGQVKIFNIHYVSRNYFKVLGVDIKGTSDLDWQNGIVINSVAAKALAQFSQNDGLGTLLSIGIENKKYKVEGIVENIPHLGAYSGSQATIYMLLDSSAVRNIQLYIKNSNKDQIKNLLNWMKIKHKNFEISNSQSLTDLIANRDALYVYLLTISSTIVFIIFIGIILSLNFQLKARLKLERQKLGVLLALGAQHEGIVIQFIKWLAPSFLLALPLAIILTSEVTREVGFQGINFDLVKNYALPLSILLFILVLTLIVSIQAVKVLKTPIQTLLKSE